ncbi:MAG: histidine phosphatase family protein [Actinobacteria bacterium]|nr:histidine phosphatase family protein [Actinomycetota bacterium]
MLLFLVRHAVTSHTGNRLSGWIPGIHLSDEGKGQVASLVELMRPVRLVAFYSSPLERCLETAKPVAASKGLRLRVRAELGEVRYGAWEGKKMESLTKTKLWRTVQGRPSEVRFPDGESLRETQARAVDGIERIRNDHLHEAVAVSTHADVIRLLAAHYAGIHLDLYQRVSISPASVSVFWLGGGGPRILKLNETGSLEGLVPPRPAKKKAR